MFEAGAANQAGGPSLKSQVFRSSGIFVPSAGLLALGGIVDVIIVGAGGGGGGGIGNSTSQIGSSGGSGGNSAFGDLVAPGGGGGGGGAYTKVYGGVPGGVPSVGRLVGETWMQQNGSPGAPPPTMHTGGRGGVTVGCQYGQGGNGAGSIYYVGSAGGGGASGSVLHVKMAIVSASVSVVVGAGGVGGAGASSNGRTGASGSDGIVIVRWWE